MLQETRKRGGIYYTPDEAVHSLVRWAVHRDSDRMLDPSSGDGRFLAMHRKSVGIEQDSKAVAAAVAHAPWALVHEGDFFTWARETRERFECAAGNPPFIRYQRFTGETRDRARNLAARAGADFSGLASSWAPFLVVAASLLKPGGRMAFVVPAEIGHAPYAVPLLRYLVHHFAKVQIVAVREKIFSDLSEDCWLLFADGFGTGARTLKLSSLERFAYMPEPPADGTEISLDDLRAHNYRLRPFLLSPQQLRLYRAIYTHPSTAHFGQIAKVSIGYVTGDNDFFHFRPSEAKARGIPARVLRPTVRNGRALCGLSVTKACVDRWIAMDEPVLLLDLNRERKLHTAVARYLETPAGLKARTGYKCRNRDPWYAVPDVTVPDAFLSYMSGAGPSLVANNGGCVCTNSVHAVSLKGTISVQTLQKSWQHPFTALSCEVEGHPLGGGMLKIEPGEAARVGFLYSDDMSNRDRTCIESGIEVLKRWRHYG